MAGYFKTLLLFGICSAFNSGAANRNGIYHVPLDQNGLMSLDWMLDYVNQRVIFEIHIPSNFTWFALGFSDRGEFFPADYCVLWYNWKRELNFQDTSANEKGVLSLDHQQDCLQFDSKRLESTIKFTFTRDFDTCDTKDYIIEDGTTHIVWSGGNDHLYQLEGLNVSSTNSNMLRVQLLKHAQTSSGPPKHAREISVLTSQVQVPDDDTTYWCHVQKLPEEFRAKHHVVQFEAEIQKSSEGLVHHMELFHCMADVDVEIPLYVGSCFDHKRPESTKVCKRVIAAWAMGATPFTYPEEAGMPIGGPDFNLYIMLELHYNNPQLKAGIIDSSGMKLYVTNKLRPMDAGVIELGLEYTDKMAIPPNQESFSLSGYCVTECTAVSLPPEGITIFGSQLHTHLTGIKVVTRHFRNGRELAELNRDDHYSQHFQEIRRLKKPVQVLPGDALITTCDYGTVDRENITLGGFAISDEMCVNYVYYFPISELEVCKSSISDQALATYFRYMHEWENQPTSEDNGRSENYKTIEWNKMRVQLLKDVYKEAPLSMQCNMSSGDRFPGYWENTPVTSILVPLPPPARKCDNINSM